MNGRPKFAIVFATMGLLALLLSHSAHSEPTGQLPRTWTTADGRYKTVATLVVVENDTVRLARADGKVIDVPLSKLSGADRAFLRSDLATEVLPDVIVGKVIGISDGDTLTVIDESKSSYKIRLEGIDCPETKQEHGTQARKALAEKVFKKQVRVRTSGKDKYRRVLGDIYVDDRWINKEMVEEGWAWHYKEYSDDEDLASAEVSARNSRSGLWNHDSPMAPWEFRHLPRVKTQPEIVVDGPNRVRVPATRVQSSVGYWLNSSSNVRHNRGCRWYGNTKSGHYCGPSEGRACGICGG